MNPYLILVLIFYKEIMDELSLDEYEELMVVKEKDQGYKISC